MRISLLICLLFFIVLNANRGPNPRVLGQNLEETKKAIVQLQNKNTIRFMQIVQKLEEYELVKKPLDKDSLFLLQP
jgi:hypothetical protein